MKRVGEWCIKIAVPVVFACVLGIAIGATAKSTQDDSFYKEIPLFTDVLSVIQSDYVEEKETKDLIYGALKGMLSSLDPHSQFMDPDTYKEMQIETRGEFGGLGIVITIRDNFLTIVAPLEDTPAYRSGLKSGDRIVKIDDKPTKDITLFDAVKLMRGKPGTEIVLTILRESVNTLLDIKVTRDIIEINSVKEARILEEGIGYVKLVEFQEKTARDLDAALQKLEKKGMTSLILDLRNNPGGLLNAAVDVSEIFLSRGLSIVSTRGRLKSQAMEFSSKAKKTRDKIPLVVLINEGSASASEIVAGAIRDHQRGVLIGMKTFGKGSVQTVSPLRDGSAVRLTTAKYYTPVGHSIHEVGIQPDVEVQMDAQEWAQIAESRERALEESVKPDETEGDESDGETQEGKAGEEDKQKPIFMDSQLARAVDLIKGINVWKGLNDHSGD